MNVSCDVIRDLLPLYVEKMASKDTRTIVDEHIESCEDCRKELNKMKLQPAYSIPADTDAGPLRSLRNKLLKKKIQTIALTILLTLTFVVIIMANLTMPENIPYSMDVVKIIERSDGTVLAEFGEEVSDYDLSRILVEDQSGYEYSITTWNSYWTRNIGKRRAQRTILNPNGENVVSVYYYSADESHDILIYGKDLYPGGGMKSLPRLVLAYYLLTAIVFTALTALLLLLFRKESRMKKRLIRILFIPVSYIIGHLCVRGFPTSSYTALRDFVAILMVAFPLYFVFLLTVSLLSLYRQKTG